MVLIRIRERRARGDDVPFAEERLAGRAAVETTRVERFDVWRAGRRQYASRHRAAAAVLPGRAGRREKRTAAVVVPEHARPDDTAGVARQIRPRVVVDIGVLLAVRARQQRHSPIRVQRRRVPEHAVGRSARRSIDERFPLRFGSRAPRDEVDDAAHRAGAIQG